MKILVIEDNIDLAGNIKDYLLQEGFLVEDASTVDAARDKLTRFPYDCVVLDIMLPDGNGLEILEFIQTEKMGCGVLIISAKNSLDDKVKGLELGADDYITKPFHLPELNARLRAIYRRKSMNGERVIAFNEISINPDTLKASVHESELDLTKKEFDLLLYMVINKNRVLTRQSIAEHLWGDYTDNLANFDFVYQHVKNLRRKISMANGTDYISTVYGLGYKFDTTKS
jgi:DNA-binding response OmpR family regulator